MMDKTPTNSTPEEDSKEALCINRCNYQFAITERTQKVVDETETIEAINSAVLYCTVCTHCKAINFGEV